MGHPYAIFWRLLISSVLLAAVLELVKAYVPPGDDAVLGTDKTMTIILAMAYFGSYWLWGRRGQEADVPRGPGAITVMVLIVASGFVALLTGLAPRLGWTEETWVSPVYAAERGWLALALGGAALALYLRETRLAKT